MNDEAQTTPTEEPDATETETPETPQETPETAPETEPTETPTEATEEPTEPEEPESYAGVKPLDSVEDVLTFHDGDGEWHGTADTESLTESSEAITKDAVYVHKATDRLSNAYRRLATMLLAFRAGVFVERKDGSIGPDWSGDSALSKRYTALVISKPLAKAGADRARITSILNQIGVYQGRKVPGQEYTVRDQFMREWARETLTLNEEEYTPAQIEDRVDSESKAAGLKSARMSRAEREANAAGPGTTRPASPLPALNTAVSEAVKSEATLSDATLIVEAHRLLSKLAVQIMPHNHWSNKAQATEAFSPLLGLVLALSDALDGTQEDWSGITDHLYGKTAKDAAAALLAEPTEPTAETPAESVAS